MVFDISVALTWILFIALFPITFFWSRRAYRILLKRDFSEVALKQGLSPKHPERAAPIIAALNLLCAGVIIAVIYAILFTGIDYQTWTAIAGSTIWIKFFLDFAISRHAHFRDSQAAALAEKAENPKD